MIVTDDDRIAALCDSMRNQGRCEAGAWLAHERLGYNYRIDEMSAALGVVQMGRIGEILEKRVRVAQMWRERLLRIEGVWVPRVAPEVDFMSWFVHVIRVGCEEAGAEAQQAVRDRVMQRFQEAGIGGHASDCARRFEAGRRAGSPPPVGCTRPTVSQLKG